MTGVTKNAIDWASRPAKNSPISGKPVAILGATPGITGTTRSQDQLRQSLKSMNAHCMDLPEFLLFRAHEKFNENGLLTDGSTRSYLEKYLISFADWMRKLQ